MLSEPISVLVNYYFEKYLSLDEFERIEVYLTHDAGHLEELKTSQKGRGQSQEQRSCP